MPSASSAVILLLGTATVAAWVVVVLVKTVLCRAGSGLGYGAERHRLLAYHAAPPRASAPAVTVAKTPATMP